MKKNQILSLVVVGTLLFGVTSATSSYIHEVDGTISICDPDSNGTKCITMQDKNLGASEAGTGTSSYGNHYQRGNNHEFAIGCYGNGCSDTVTSSAVTTKAPWDNSYNNYGYNGGITNFMKGSSDYRENNRHYDGLWGGANDSQANNWGYDEENNVATNVTGRQGPCGEGYHVPSQGERGTLLKYWAANYTGKTQNSLTLEGTAPLYKFTSNSTAAGQFKEDFKIPFAGNRNYNDARVYSVGYYAYLWSSSPRVGYDYARYFYLTPDEAYASRYNNRAYAFSVRCFKDSYLSFPSSEGGEPQVIVNIAEFNGGQNTCSGSNFIFENIVAGTSTGTHTLSGVFQCAFGNGRSSSTVTLQLSGDLVADGDRVISGSNLKMKNSEWTVSPVGLKFANTLINTWNALTATQTLFQKTANLIGVASGVVEVQLTVPGGTPDGTYNGTLVLTY